MMVSLLNADRLYPALPAPARAPSVVDPTGEIRAAADQMNETARRLEIANADLRNPANARHEKVIRRAVIELAELSQRQVVELHRLTGRGAPELHSVRCDVLKRAFMGRI